MSQNPYCPKCDNLTPSFHCKPCGLDFSQNTDHAKRYNSGKVDFTLIPIDAQEEEARVWGAGEVKYGRNNWEKLWGSETVRVVMASLLRHAAAIQCGEVRDPETGYQHAAHIRCNAAMLVRYFTEQEGKANG